MHCATDISDPAACEALMQHAVERFGGIDAVAQVAAADTLFGTLASTSSEDWMTSMKINVLGTLQVAQAAVPALKQGGGGSIVLVGSQSMWDPPPSPQIAYASAKGALISSMFHMVRELGPDKIRVNMVVPTWMWGPPVQGYVAWQAGERGVSEEEIIAEITARMPLGEIPADEDVAEAIVFFCSDRARMITGETLLVNAGEILR
jgi:NAD(P)-dependent dehydrogenase (short-subunit alcohol dehydrogenase family)